MQTVFNYNSKAYQLRTRRSIKNIHSFHKNQQTYTANRMFSINLHAYLQLLCTFRHT